MSTEATKPTAIDEVKAERIRQDAKWGQQNHHPLAWLAILGEEVGEANKAALEAYFPGYTQHTDWGEYRKELIQVAAVAIAMIESIDRNPAPGSEGQRQVLPDTIRWFKNDPDDDNPDDFTARHGDYILRAEEMDTKSWWWCVYFGKDQIDQGWGRRTCEDAKQTAERVARKHERSRIIGRTEIASGG